MNLETPPTRDRESGTTLVELLVAVVILGLAVIALLSGLGTAVIVSDQHRQQAVANAAVHNYAEAVAAATYVNCATTATATYASPAGYASPTGYTSTITAVQYWDAPNRKFVPGCPSPDAGEQKVSLRVKSNRSAVSQTFDIIIRRATA